MNLKTSTRVLVRFSDQSVMAGKVLEVEQYGIVLKIEPTGEFKTGATIFIPYSSIKYIDLT